MNTLIDPLKRIARDLVDKKLWPVAVLLLAALVALPVLIGGGSSTENSAAPVAAATPAPGVAGAGSLITVADPSASGKDSRPGAIKDPFYDPPEASAPASGAAAPASGPAAPASGPGAPASGPGASGGTSKSGGTPATGSPPPQTSPPVQTIPRPPATSGAASVYYRTVARWYQADAGKSRPLVRLTPLGGRAAPAALYLGVTKPRSAYAVFLLSPNATSAGDAECEQSDCRVIGLRAGQSQTVTVQPADGGPARTYHLEVVSVRTVRTDGAAARDMRARVHTDGRDVMRGLWQHRPTAEALQPIRYDQDSGLLYTTPTTKASK